MNAFRECLIALVPPLQRVKIWPACYDDWDDIVQSLFRNVVIRTVEFAFEDESKVSQLDVPRYGVRYEDYSAKSFVEVVHPAISDMVVAVFAKFDDASPFDSAVYICVDTEGKAAPEVRTVPVSGATFRFQWRDPTGELHAMDKLSVML
jgi:hypothetical protein